MTPAPPPTTRLATARLVLRLPRTVDVPALREALRKNVVHLRPWSIAPAPGEDPASLSSVSRTVLRNRREWKTGEAYVFVVSPVDDERRIVGRVAFGGVQRGAFQNAHVGYWIDAELQRRGLATEALRAAVDFAFRSAGLHRVQAAVMPRNLASTRVVEKAGFRREGVAERYLCINGVWESHTLFAVTREEWP